MAVTIEADKSSAVFKGDDITYTVTRTGSDDRRTARHGCVDPDRGFPGGGGPHEDGDD